MKTSVLDGPSYQIQKFSKLHFCYDSKNLAEITRLQVLDFLNLALNANKMSFLFNFTKISKGHQFTVTEPKILKLLPDTPFDTSFQNNVLVSLQLFPFVCY